MIKQEVIERIRQETDIVELINSYVPLKKVGRYYRGLCPFHAERSPSFYVSPERQSYHCFGCGAGGTAITFVMAYEKLEFPEAVRFLGKRLGITVEEERRGGDSAFIYEVCEKATRFFEECLVKFSVAQKYLAERGLSANTVRRFRLGFAPGGNILRGAASRIGISETGLLRAGLVVKRENGLIDYFRERIIFPIFSLSGKVIGFGGRVLGDGEPKYLNSPDTPIFRKGENLYGIFQAKAYIRENVPILVEGNFDLLALVEQGINNVVAGLGTALTPAQAALLRRYNQEVILCYDGDEAGRNACRRSLEILLRAGIDPQIVILPTGFDPDSYIRQGGKDSFFNRLAERKDFVDFIVMERNLDTVAKKRAVLNELVSLLKVMADETARELYVNRISDMFRIDRNRLFNLVNNSSPDRHEANLSKERSSQQLEEKLVAAAVLERDFARIAQEFSLSDTVENETLKKIARLAEENWESDTYGPSFLMDLTDDEAVRSRIARWTFSEFMGVSLPSIEEFRNRVKRFRSQWLHRQIKLATEEGDEVRIDALLKERNRLLKDI